jgi:methionyl-tRNA formyltransferase
MLHNKAVVFAYHTVGVKCIQTLIDGGFSIPLVISHEDSPGENIWFESVKEICKKNHIECITPSDIKDPLITQAIDQIQPDYIFSFYYRFMIPDHILSLAQVAALNMHGSLLPKYRGRVPINWAVLNGEVKTGATLHVMETKPDAGDIIHQKSVAILPDETAYAVFLKVADIAQLTLAEMIPSLLKGDFPRRPNRLQEGSYFGGRKPEDGKIDWHEDAQTIYNLVRAVAPPYPGAFTEIGDKRLIIAEARLASLPNRSFSAELGLQVVDNRIYGFCGDHRALLVTELMHGKTVVSANDLQQFLRNTST